MKIRNCRYIKVKEDDLIIMAYILRLDDAAPRRNHFKWNKIEGLLRKYNVQPLIGIIPNVQDRELLVYEEDKDFWERVRIWQKYDFAHIALHGYQHVYLTKCGGINPVNLRSEFAGVSLNKQREMLKCGYEKLQAEGIATDVFFAPSHTFDENTIIALKDVTPIRIISDTIAYDVYQKDGITYVPQQSGKCRQLPFRTTTFCYHPNEMCTSDFTQLENFLKKYAHHFVKFSSVIKERTYDSVDLLLHNLYFYRKIRKQKRG